MSFWAVDNPGRESTSYAPDDEGLKLLNDTPAIAVLGPIEGEAQESIAATVASSLAAGGYAVIVSGHGRMASSAMQAAIAQGGAVCVVSEANDEAAEDATPNKTTITRANPLQCTETILDHADALVILPGDLQAMATLMQVWSYGPTQRGPYRPLVLLGEEWPKLVNAMATAADLDRAHRAMVTFAVAADEAVESLRYYIAP